MSSTTETTIEKRTDENRDEECCVTCGKMLEEDDYTNGPFQYFVCTTQLPHETIGGWILSGRRIYPTDQASFDELCEIKNRRLEILPGSVFVERDSYFVLYQIAEKSGNLPVLYDFKDKYERDSS